MADLLVSEDISPHVRKPNEFRKAKAKENYRDEKKTTPTPDSQAGRGHDDTGVNRQQRRHCREQISALQPNTKGVKLSVVIIIKTDHHHRVADTNADRNDPCAQHL